MTEARYWHDAGNGRAACDLCPHACEMGEGQTGRCGVRQRRDGVLEAAGYGRLSSMQPDPIEKKPLYHFHPGATIFSIGGWGCNFSCDFCQNWSISQRADLSAEPVAPEDVVQAARRAGSSSVAFTYNEPLVGIEYALDCSQAARAAGLATVLVTNGYLRPEPGRDILALTDALNIDIKSMNEEFYRRYCKASLAPVLAFARQAAQTGCHVEITCLLIPGLNDAPADVDRLANWISDNLGRHTPLHLSAYFPRYRMNVPPTDAQALETAARLCEQRLDYVYLGNVASHVGRDTLCAKCGAVLIARHGYAIDTVGLLDGVCAACGQIPPIVLPAASATENNGKAANNERP